MRRLVVLAALMLGAAGPAPAQVPAPDAGQPAVAAVVRITASVESIDAADRTVTLKGPRAKVVTLPVSHEVRNLDQFKAGDIVVVRYVEALALDLKRSTPGPRERTDAPAVPPAKPGDRQLTGIADVVGVDPKRQVVTLRVQRRTVDVKVRDPGQLKLLKLGDQVEVTYTEAVAIAIEPAPKSARLTQLGF